VTVLNAAKPAVVDDAAYLFFARQIAADPLDPYGFELFWYRHPQPAMGVLAPPVLPYWLGAGVALFGENLFLLKLWLFPFPLILCLAADSLLRRFARGTERMGLVLLVLSAAVLPMVNFMLDVPAVALGAAAVAVFVRGCDRRHLRLVLAAGVLAGLAMQTKYTMLTVPAVLAWYTLVRRRLVPAVLATAVAVAVFAVWELLLSLRYDQSHFLFHVRDQQSGMPAGDSTVGRLRDWLDTKGELFRPLVAQLGLVAAGWGLYAGRAVGFGPRFVAGVAAAAVVGLAAVCFLPYGLIGGPDSRHDLASSVLHPLGSALLVTLGLTVLTLCVRWRRSRIGRVRWNRDTWFLVGWLGIELAGYFVLTPFPATRRVIPLCVVIGLIACRLVSRMSRARPGRKPERWITGYAAAVGVGVLALDVWDALPERQLADRAAEVIGDPGSHRVWTQGHWGWQYYTDRRGMRLVVPGKSELKAGDWLVHPVIPDDAGFYRPYHGEATFRLEPTALERVDEFVWDDPIPAQTIPNLYGGNMPIGRRAHPRLRVVVYRVTRDWVPAPDRQRR
jgi:hypothetical protein